MHQKTVSILVQILACCFMAPNCYLTKVDLLLCQLDPRQQIPVTSKWKHNHFHSGYWTWKCCLQYDNNFVSDLNGLILFLSSSRITFNNLLHLNVWIIQNANIDSYSSIFKAIQHGKCWVKQTTKWEDIFWWMVHGQQPRNCEIYNIIVVQVFMEENMVELSEDS